MINIIAFHSTFIIQNCGLPAGRQACRARIILLLVNVIKMFRIIINIIILVLLFTFIVFSPQLRRNENKVNYKITSAIENINKEKIIFGHRSVGNNIIQGIGEIISENNAQKLALQKIENIGKLPGKYFLEANIGSNGDPKSKIDDFHKIVDQLAQNEPTIAMMKLCYADIKQNADINDIFKYYTEIIDSLHEKYPNLIIIHFTVPLTSKRTILMSIKDFIKARSNSSMLDNIVRNKYNQFLLSKYPADQIFDLAKIESTYLDGTFEEYSYQGKVYNSLIPEYSDDGGHLNEKGRHIVAEKFISFMANKIIK